MAIKVAINGFGRIGRSVVRAWLKGGWPDIEIVAINDIAPLPTCAYLFQYDSVFGPWPDPVDAGEGELRIGARVLPFTSVADLALLDMTGVDVVMECTGLARTRSFAEAGLDAGAARVLVSGPSPEADFTVVMGANEEKLQADHRVISNASCTTNAIAPLAARLDAEYGLESALMTTVHCYTGSQPTVDTPMGSDMTRSRAAALSMVPTTTSAAHLVDVVLPDLAGRITGSAVRVPTASVSCVDLAVITRAHPDADDVRRLFRAGAGPIIGYTEKPLVSTDLRARPESVIVQGTEIKRAEGGMLRVFGWYDNEWGFSCRMLDVARTLGRLG
ncbi:MAG: glyceraldehyde 3-phosphate dehydrogenase NAD-binding domain-containing protein [Roseicyclus sp.]|jgi:glyceraldehyde 3-phosphate dehydrogenase